MSIDVVMSDSTASTTGSGKEKKSRKRLRSSDLTDSATASPSLSADESSETRESRKEERAAKKLKKSRKSGDLVETTGTAATLQDTPATDASPSKDAKKDKKEKKDKKDKKEKKEKKDKKSDSGSESGVDETLAFNKFPISSGTVARLEARGISALFPIQAKTFDAIFAGKDVIGQARTGSGKTLAFALPVIEKLLSNKQRSQARGRGPSVIVMAPTRELAKQVGGEFEQSAGKELETFCIYGGVMYEPQENAMRRGVDVLVGTPGRIVDHMNRGNLKVDNVKYFVLDEADRMLETGFQEQMDEVLAALPQGDQKPQILLFSATMPSWVTSVATKRMNKDKVTVTMVGQNEQRTSTTIRNLAIMCPYQERASALGDIVRAHAGQHGRTMVFASTKREANELVMSAEGGLDAQVLHGDIQQKQREITLQGFRDGTFRVLVATDVAARGLDIPEVDLVVQTEPPVDVENYIHRAGRTGRAGKAGVCVLFFKPQQEYMLNLIERRARCKFARIGPPQPADLIEAASRDASKSLDSVPASMMALFRPVAERTIDERGAVDALAAAMAHISGASNIAERSLLSAQRGYSSYQIEVTEPIRSATYVWRVLENRVSMEVKESIRGMRMLANYKGCAFDVPQANKATLEAAFTDAKNAVLTQLTELPELAVAGGGAGGGGGGGGGGFGRQGYGGGGRTGQGSYGKSGGGGGGGGGGFGGGRPQRGFRGGR